ncbi:hypothetical protein [Kitasatospora sp. NPDC002040]|uniref:hypothetical protein n=1 Tax=Kitasatospora sp. NPDC002040 TaxID=3154661 RepID=UPI00331DD8B7
MTSPPTFCSSTHPEQCALSLRRSVIEAARWTATSTVLAVGEQAAHLAHTLADRHTPVISLDAGRHRPPYGRPFTTTLTADPLLLPTLGLPELSLALVSGYPPSRTEQLLLDLDVLMRRESAVVFLPSQAVPNLLQYATPATRSAFHCLRAVLLTHTSRIEADGMQPPHTSPRHSNVALTALRP